MTQIANGQDADLTMILADMATEFLESCEDRLEEVDQALDRLRSSKGFNENDILEIKRHIHSLKGMGTTFGFSSISLLAHALEDYFEALFVADKNGIHDIQHFVDRIREVAESRINWPDRTVAQIIHDMPLSAKRRTVRKDGLALSILVLMPKGLQRKIVASELSQFGFSVLTAENGVDAIEKSLRLRPDLFMSSMILDDLTGEELAGIFYAIKATSENPFLLVTSTDLEELMQRDLPPNVSVLRKGPSFAKDLMTFFKTHNYAAN